MQHANKIDTIIIEDDTSAREYLAEIINDNFKELNLIGYSDSVDQSIKLLKNNSPELVFMDIILKDGTAFDILNKLKDCNFEIIFITSFNEYLEKAMKHYAFQFLLKPIDLQKLKNVVDRYKSLRDRMFSLSKYQMFSKFIDETNSKLALHVNNEYKMIDLKEIVKCEASGNYTYFFLSDNQKILASKSLKYYEELLRNKGFFRIHRSSLVNIDFIKSIYKKEAVVLTTNEKIRISQRNKSQVTSLINLLS